MTSQKKPTQDLSLFNEHTHLLSKENFLYIAKIGMSVYPFWSIIDSVIGDKGFFYYLSLRMVIILPLFFVYLGMLKNKIKDVDFVVFLFFIIVGFGVSISAYSVGGWSSDYYAGMLLLSFIQFTVAPIHVRYVALLDIIYLLIYFPLNFIPFDYTYKDLILQLALYINFGVFKFICTKRAFLLIYGSYRNYKLNQELTHNKEITGLFGELCHLISNPLFISQASLKRALKVEDEAKRDQHIEKSLQAQGRIHDVVSKMQLFYQDNNMTLSNYRDHFSDNGSEDSSDDDKIDPVI